MRGDCGICQHGWGRVRGSRGGVWKWASWVLTVALSLWEFHFWLLKLISLGNLAFIVSCPLYYSNTNVGTRIHIPLDKIFRNFCKLCQNLISLLDTTKVIYLLMIRKTQSTLLLTVLLSQELVIKAAPRSILTPYSKVVCLRDRLINRLLLPIRIGSAFHFFKILYCAMNEVANFFLQAVDHRGYVKILLHWRW